MKPPPMGSSGVRGGLLSIRTMTDTQIEGGGAQGSYGPQVAQAAAMLKARQVSQGSSSGIQGADSQPTQQPQAQGNPGADMDALRRQMQATRAVGDNYTQQMQAAAGGGVADYGQAQAQQLAAQMQAFAARSQAYARMGQLSPQAFTRASQAQAMAEAGMNTGDLQSLWATQDQAGPGQ